MLGEAIFQSVVRAVQFGISFLDEHHPQLRTIGPTEHRTSIRVTRDVVVDDDHLPLSILAQPDPVDTLIIDPLSDEQPLDKGWQLCQSGQSAQEPTIGDLTLLDIARFDLVLEHFRVSSQELRGSSPLRELHEGKLLVLSHIIQ